MTGLDNKKKCKMTRSKIFLQNFAIFDSGEFKAIQNTVLLLSVNSNCIIINHIPM